MIFPFQMVDIIVIQSIGVYIADLTNPEKNKEVIMGYIDPGLFGIISQIGIAIGLVVVSAVAFIFKPFKKIFQKKEQSESESEKN